MKPDGTRHYNIPIFIPQQACPHQCIYCNQRYISGYQKSPSAEQVKKIIDEYLATAEESAQIQIAFFGGTFTGLPVNEQLSYLKITEPYINKGKIRSIRLSTRPDYITPEILDMLKHYHVEDIELGAQSLDDGVLKFSERGHTCQDVIISSELIKTYGFKLGLQMMIGLPGDTLEKSIATAKKIVELGASSTRIYPTLVIDRTPLAELYKKGDYTPLSLDTAVQWTKEIYKIFQTDNITVLRVGLHPSEDLINGKGFLAGPFHVSFFELVLTELWKERLQNISAAVNKVIVNPKSVNHAIGYNSVNLKMLRQRNPKIKILQDSSLAMNTFVTE